MEKINKFHNDTSLKAGTGNNCFAEYDGIHPHPFEVEFKKSREKSF